MPNWKYPCTQCNKPVKTNQKGLQCNDCLMWVHVKCTDLTETQYDFLEQNENVPFFCLKCKPRPFHSELIFENTTVSYSDTSLNDSSSSYNFSSAHSSDFEYVDTESDSESRGLNFESLPTYNIPANHKKRNHNKNSIFVQNRNYKYPCLICRSPCKDRVQNSISCTLCDEWVHQKCSDLTLKQFKKYCSPDHAGEPYYCEYCRFGFCSGLNLQNQTCLNANEINSLDANDMYDMCSNSIFKNQEDSVLSEYYNTEEANLEIKKAPGDILLIHINAVSLCKNYDTIIDTLAELKPNPSIIFLSETRLHDSKLKEQLKQVRIEGYRIVYDNSPTNAGGTAIYVSDNLNFNKRPDIKFEHPECEACFIEVVCDTPTPNPIFGALYRHPVKNVQLFTSYLGEFLENFAARGTSLTIMGDMA